MYYFPDLVAPSMWKWREQRKGKGLKRLNCNCKRPFFSKLGYTPEVDKEELKIVTKEWTIIVSQRKLEQK